MPRTTERTTTRAIAEAQAAAEMLTHLTRARDAARRADAGRTLARIEHAIASARGAIRNTGYRVSRAMETAAAADLDTTPPGFCPDCRSPLTNRTTQHGRPSYCDVCDREHDQA